MALTKQQKREDRDLGGFEERQVIKKGVKGTELNVGPNMSRGDVGNKKAQDSRSMIILNQPSPSDEADSADANQQGRNAEKSFATTYNQSPDYKTYKKGGSVRGHGIEKKGKTKGRFV